VAIAEILKGNPKYLGANLAQGHANFFSACGFMVGFSKSQLHAKFEVASFNHCTNIKGKPQNIGECL